MEDLIRRIREPAEYYKKIHLNQIPKPSVHFPYILELCGNRDFSVKVLGSFFRTRHFPGERAGEGAQLVLVERQIGAFHEAGGIVGFGVEFGDADCARKGNFLPVGAIEFHFGDF